MDSGFNPNALAVQMSTAGLLKFAQLVLKRIASDSVWTDQFSRFGTESKALRILLEDIEFFLIDGKVTKRRLVTNYYRLLKVCPRLDGSVNGELLKTSLSITNSIKDFSERKFSQQKFELKIRELIVKFAKFIELHFAELAEYAHSLVEKLRRVCPLKSPLHLTPHQVNQLKSNELCHEVEEIGRDLVGNDYSYVLRGIKSGFGTFINVLPGFVLILLMVVAFAAGLGDIWSPLMTDVAMTSLCFLFFVGIISNSIWTEKQLA